MFCKDNTVAEIFDRCLLIPIVNNGIKKQKKLRNLFQFHCREKNSGVRHLIPVHNRHTWFLTPYRQSKCRSEQVTHYGSHSQKNKSPTLLPTPVD